MCATTTAGTTTGNTQKETAADRITVGIDVGSETTKVVFVSARGGGGGGGASGTLPSCEIVRNDVGGHSTPTVVEFPAGKQLPRRIGQALTSSIPSNNTVLDLPRWLSGETTGRDDGDDKDPFREFCVTQVVVGGNVEEEQEEQGNPTSTKILVEYNCETKEFTSTAIMAMFLGKIQTFIDATIQRILSSTATSSSSASSSSASTDYAYRYRIAIGPDTSKQARAEWLDAAYAAGWDLRRVRLVESGACALACYRRKFPNFAFGRGASRSTGTSVGTKTEEKEKDGEGDDTEQQTSDGDAKSNTNQVVLVVDMGKTQTTASVLGIPQSKETETETKSDDEAAEQPPIRPRVLSSVRDKTLGAGAIDIALWEHFASTVPVLQKKASIRKNSKGGQRLLNGCRKLKHLLSQLKEGSVTVENVVGEDGDITLTATRQQVREMCCGSDANSSNTSMNVAFKLRHLITTVLQQAHVSTIEDISSIEICGGGCRIPWIKDVILDTVVQSLGKQPSSEEDGPSSSSSLGLSYSLDDTSIAMGAALIGEEASSQGEGESKEKDEDDGRIELRRKLKEAEDAMKASDSEMQERSDYMNRIEAKILEMRSAKSDTKYGHLIPSDEMDQYLNEIEDWLFSEHADDATKEDMKIKYEQVVDKTNEIAKEYFTKVQQDKSRTEQEMEAAAKQAQIEKETNADGAAGDDGNEADNDFRKLPKKRRMEIVLKNKSEANELFGDGNYKFAAARYTKALGHCAKFVDLGPEDVQEVNDLKVSLNLNLALAYSKLENYDQALRVCNDALALDANSAKALYRRASIYYEKKQWDKAKHDIKRAEASAPEDKAVKKLQDRIDIQIKKQKQKEKKMAQKMFG